MGIFSSNSLLFCVLLSRSPLVNATSPPLFFWIIDQNKKSSFKEWWLLHSRVIAAGDSALAGVTSPRLGCHAIFGLRSFHMHSVGGKVVLGKGGWAACPEESDCMLFCSASFGKSSDPTSPYISANRNSSPATSPITIGSSTSRGSQWQPASSCPAPVSTNTTASVQHVR